MKTKEKYIVTATELKQNFGKYMGHVEKFNDVVITKNGKKVARLTPYVTDLEQYLVVRDKALDYQYGGKKVSYEEFMAIYEKSELRMEFINGEIHLLASLSVTHQQVLGQLYPLFHVFFKGSKCRVFLAPFDVHFRKKDITEPDVMQPDLIVACDLEGNVTDKDRYMGTPTLVAEVLSNSTRTKDMIDKLNTYRLSGVKEYWIVDPRQKTIIVYSLKDYEIEYYKAYELGATAQSVFFEGLEVAVAALFSDLV
ncbi:MAG: type II toxin-antitoxin system Phd/YefM family antitoxin [Firmicutes bacterium]|nr:type II toxin-antitoxin system Phd/YefM family antitoxin [Bacillota bacterium]